MSGEVEVSKKGAPTKEYTLKGAILEGPYTNGHQKWVAISQFFSVNAKRNLMKFADIPMDEFCEWTKIPEREVINAPLTKEYLDVALAAKSGEAQMSFAAALPQWKLALDKLYEEGDSKAFINGMAQFAEIIKFKQVDTGHLIPAEEKGPEEIIKAIVKDLEEIFGPEAVVQKIIPVMAKDDGGAGVAASQLVQGEVQAEGDPATLPKG